MINVYSCLQSSLSMGWTAKGSGPGKSEVHASSACPQVLFLIVANAVEDGQAQTRRSNGRRYRDESDSAAAATRGESGRGTDEQKHKASKTCRRVPYVGVRPSPRPNQQVTPTAKGDADAIQPRGIDAQRSGAAPPQSPGG